MPTPTDQPLTPTTEAPLDRRAISTPTAEHHPLVQTIVEAEDAAISRQFATGLGMPLRALKLLIANRQLWRPALWPALINLLVFCALAFGLIELESAYFATLWAEPTGSGLMASLAILAYWFVKSLVTILVLIASYMLTLVLGSVVASPFNDHLSEQTELVLRDLDQLEARDEPFWRGALRSMISSGGVSLLYLSILIPLLALNLLPGIGSLIYTVLAALIGAYFVALEYTDIFLERRRFRLREKLRIIWSHRQLTIGFGLGVGWMMWVPVLNFFCAPIAVITGTTVGLGLEARGLTREDDQLPP